MGIAVFAGTQASDWMSGHRTSLMLLKNFSVGMYSLAGVFVGVFVFVLTLAVAPYYISGDQRHYINAYNGIADLSLAEGFVFYTATLGSTEIVHYLLTWLASGFGIEKNFVMAVSNALLAYFSMRVFEKWRASVLVAVAIVITNFYMFVLYFSAERLKFGFLFLSVSILYLGQGKRFYMLVVLAVFSHVQVLLAYASMFSAQLVKNTVGFFKTFQLSLKYIILPVIMLGVLTFLLEHIYSKLVVYAAAAAQNDIFDFVRIFLLLLLSMWYSKNKNQTLLLFMPLVLAVYFVGSDRVNMMAYFVFLYYGLQCKGGLNFGVLTTTVYFTLKSYGFVVDIIRYGDGFETMVGQLYTSSQVIHG